MSSLDISSLLTSTNISALFSAATNENSLSSSWGTVDDPSSWGDVATGLFGNIEGVDAILSRYVGDTLPTATEDPTAPGNTWIYTLFDYDDDSTSSSYSSTTLSEISDIATLASILSSESTSGSYNTLALSDLSGLSGLASLLGYTDSSSTDSVDISTIASLLGTGSLSVDYTGIDFSSFNLEDTDMASLILGLVSTVGNDSSVDYSSLFSAATNDNSLSSSWGTVDDPSSWGDVATGLFGNIEGVDAILSRYVGDTLPTATEDPTAPGNTWIYTLFDY